jgi:hypothetical protein
MPGDLFERAPENPAQIHWTVGRINSGCGLRYVARLKKNNDLGPLYAER